MVVPNAVDCVAAASFFRFVDHIVVDQRSIVEQFDGGCSVEHVFGNLSGQEFCAEDNDDGANLFAFRLQIRVDYLFKQGTVAFK